MKAGRGRPSRSRLMRGAAWPRSAVSRAPGAAQLADLAEQPLRGLLGPHGQRQQGDPGRGQHAEDGERDQHLDQGEAALPHAGARRNMIRPRGRGRPLRARRDLDLLDPRLGRARDSAAPAPAAAAVDGRPPAGAEGGRLGVGQRLDRDVAGDHLRDRLAVEPGAVGRGRAAEPQQGERGEAENGERHQHLDQGEALFAAI